MHKPAKFGIPSIQPIINLYARIKIYTQRINYYTGIFRTAGIAYLVLKDWNLGYTLVGTLFVLGVILMMFFGFLEDRLGVIQEEERTFAERNPLIVEILKDVKEIKENVLNERSQ